MPRRGDPVVVIGTPQAEDDLLHKLASNDWFVWQRHPAISDEESRRVLWPEVFSYDVLGQKRREVGEKALLVEYMLVPLRTLDGYFSREEIEACVNPEMLPYSLDEPPRNHENTKLELGSSNAGGRGGPVEMSVSAPFRTSISWLKISGLEISQ